jgi:hypothetical protein
MRKASTFLASVLALVMTALALPAFAQAAAAPAPDLGKMLWAAVLGAAPLLWPVINGPFVSFLTEMTKRLPAVPFQGNTLAGLIVALGAYSTLTTLVCNFLIAWLSGNVASFDMGNAVMVLAQIVGSVLTAAGAFGLFQKRKASNP